VVTLERFRVSEERGAGMLIDAHCHIDQFPTPEEVVRDCEKNTLRVVAVTNLPSHFAVAADRLRGHHLISAALGMHPLAASDGVRELAAFKRMAPNADYIGEIGLDFSRQGIATKSIQMRVFEEILRSITDRPRFITLHSRGAESAVLEALGRHNIRGAVFHWFTGSDKTFNDVLENGHYFSVNVASLATANGKRTILGAPKEAILVESDGPFAKIKSKPAQPGDVAAVYSALATQWGVSFEAAVGLVENNFRRIASLIAR